MGDRTGIAWTNATWNPIAGCTRVSAGCDHCYAAELAARKLRKTRQYHGLATITPSGRAAFNGQIRLLPERLDEPLHWRKPRRVFVNSMSDLFHDGVPDEYIDRVWDVMRRAERHTFQVLTKRPERMLDYFAKRLVGIAVDVLPNLWLGVSAEDQHTADERVPLLLATPAVVRFVSAEPLLGPIELRNGQPNRWSRPTRMEGTTPCEWTDPGPDYLPLDWVIVGGESGPGYRPMDIAWAQSIADQCRAAGVPVFVKQDSGPRPGQQGRVPDKLWALKQFPFHA